MVIDKILFQPFQPEKKNALWAKPVKGGFALYLYYNGCWNPQVLMDDKRTISPEDDIPLNIGSEGVLGPDTVGSEQIIDNSIMMDDLNEEVRNMLDDIYTSDEEALYINGTKPL